MSLPDDPFLYYREVYAPLADQTEAVLIDDGDRCLRIDPSAPWGEVRASLALAYHELEAERKLAGAPTMAERLGG